MRRLGCLLRSALVLALCLAALEGAAAFFIHSLPVDEPYFRYASLRQVFARGAHPEFSWLGFRPHRYLGYSIPPQQAPPGPDDPRPHGMNTRGLRGPEIAVPKPQGAYRILCLGGSTMYDSEIEPNNETFARQLERQLHDAGYPRVEVINGAISGYQSIESLIHLQLRLLDLEPDMLLVYDNFNDILARLVWPQTAYQGDGSGHTEAAAIHIARWTWQEDINLVRIARRLLDPPSAAKAMLKFMACFPDSALTAEFVTQLSHDTYPAGIFTDLDLDAVLDANPPRYFERNTRNLIHIARGNGIIPVFHTFRLCQAKQDLFSHPIFLRGVREHNDVLRRVCQDLDTPLFDFEQAFPDDPELYADGIHHNAAGAAHRAKLVTGHLIHTLFPALPNAPRPNTTSPGGA